MKLLTGCGLLTGYINKFLKRKTEASGFPSHVTTEEQKEFMYPILN
jgi:hypothetical protein